MPIPTPEGGFSRRLSEEELSHLPVGCCVYCGHIACGCCYYVQREGCDCGTPGRSDRLRKNLSPDPTVLRPRKKIQDADHYQHP